MRYAKSSDGRLQGRDFYCPFTEDKGEYALVRPLTDTAMNELRIDAVKEAGADEALAAKIFMRRQLQKAVTGWQGFYDAAGNELRYSPEMLKEICECDPEFAGLLALRIRNVARLGELAERKN